MTERNDSPRPVSSATPVPSAPSAPGHAAGPVEEEARARVTALEREAKAMGTNPTAALLFHEMGLLWESPLKHPRNAAVAYQSAYKLAPRFLANIRAARRLFAEVGNWVMVVQLIDAELNATQTPRTRAALLFEKGHVLDQKLSREADALGAYNQCLALDPEDATVLCQLEQIYSEKGDHLQVVKVQRLLAKVVQEPAAQAHYLLAAGLILEDRLKNLPEAATVFREAFKLDRKDPLLLAAIKRVSQREGTVDEELSALAAEAELLGAQAAPTYLQIAKAYERLERMEDALAALNAARRVSPAEPLILSELARIYESTARHEELADVLSTWVTYLNDESELVALNLRLAALYEEKLKRDNDAITRYHAILQKIPGHTTSLAALGKLYHRSENWLGLLSTYDAEIAATDDPKQKAARLYKAAEVLEERLKEQEDAIARYNQCLQLSPGYLPAQKALTRLFEKQSRWGDLVQMHEQDLLQTTDKEQQIGTLQKIASIYEDRLDDLPHAIETLRRTHELAPEHLGTVRSLARLYERVGQWADVIEFHEREATLSGDTKQVVSLTHRNAEILEEHVKDRDGAIATYERVLGLAPSYLPALKALGRLYFQTEQWEALVRMYRAEAEIASSPEQAAALTYKIGELYEQKLKKESEALASYRAVLQLSAHYFPAIRALGHMYRQQGAWEEVIEILKSEAANRTDPQERANAMFQAAAIWEDQLKNTDQAAEGYQEALRLNPNHTPALQQLERLLTGKDDVKELILVLDRQTQAGSSAMRVASWLKLARLYLDRLNEPNRAAQCCESVLSLEPNNLSALKLLERIRSGDKPRRMELRARLAEAIGDAKLAAAMRLSALEQSVGAVAKPTEALVQQLKSTWETDPNDESLGFMLERVLSRVGDARALVDLLEKRRATLTEEQDLVNVSLRLGDLYFSPLGELGKATSAYETALKLSPGLYPALTGLARIHAEQGNHNQALATFDNLALNAKDPATAIDALLHAGRFSIEKLHNPDMAVSYFQKVLAREPLHPVAGPALDDLLASKGGASDLAALNERRGDAKLAAKDNIVAASHFFAAAKAHLEGMKNKVRAAELLDKALVAQPTHTQALELKGDLALEAQNYAEAAAAYSVRVQQGGDPKHLAAIHLKLGALYTDQLGDGTRAAAHLQTALASEPDSVEALERLALVYMASQTWTGAADCLKKAIAIEKSPHARARHAIALAKVYEEGLKDPKEAVTIYRQALQWAPGDATVLDRLAVLYEKLGNVNELVQMLEQQVSHASDTQRALQLKLRVAELYARQMDNAPKAIATYRSVLDLAPQHLQAHIAIADLYSRDPSQSSMAVETHRTLLKIEPGRADSLHALFRLWEQSKQLDKAFCTAGVLNFLRAGTEAELAFYNDGRNRLPKDTSHVLAAADVQLLHHPQARTPLLDVLRAIGDQLTKVHPPALEQLGVDRKTDRLKNDHPVFKEVRALAQIFGVEELEVYQSKKVLVGLDTTEPLSVCVGQEVVRRFNAREQRFLLGRGALGLLDKTAVLRKLSVGETADLLGNSIRIHQPHFTGLGKKNDDASKALRKAYSRKALRALEEPAAQLANLKDLALPAFLEGISLSADRAGLALSGDITSSLATMLKDDSAGGTRADTPEAIRYAVSQRHEVRELMAFALSDDFFKLRQRLGFALL
ncbi:MAG: tetratricopeptide repeat protein [Myxococcaceae bacterium]|nr:tetratricopeptide repeat protein [Myxococcaceae bacterium]